MTTGGAPPPSLAEAFDRSHASEPELPLGATMSGLRQIPFYQVLAGLGGKPEQRPSVYRDRYDAEIAYFEPFPALREVERCSFRRLD